MKKLLSFFALSAIVLSMASCGGNDGNVPEIKNLTFKIEALSTKVHYVITATDPNAYVYWDCKKYTPGIEAHFREEIEERFKASTFQSQAQIGNIVIGRKERFYTSTVDTKYIVLACCVEADAEGKAKIVGNIAYEIFSTMPKRTLNGVFSVSASRKVHFSQANVYKQNAAADFSFLTNQWDYKDSYSTYPRDKFTWGLLSDLDAPWFVLSKDEWWYLFRGRPYADRLFAHATLSIDGNNIHGLIILPDNWQDRGDVNLRRDGALGFVWDEEFHWYVQPTDNYNGYDKNPISASEWEVLEYAGAVFLPAAGSSMALAGYYGHYWSNTPGTESDAYFFEFDQDDINMSHVYDQPNAQRNFLTIRPVREVQ